jgi:hypothetical protein
MAAAAQYTNKVSKVMHFCIIPFFVNEKSEGEDENIANLHYVSN